MDGAWSWVLMGAWELTPPALSILKFESEFKRAHSVPAISRAECQVVACYDPRARLLMN